MESRNLNESHVEFGAISAEEIRKISFKIPNDLSHHILRVHLNVVPCLKPRCAEKFGLSNSLSQHMSAAKGHGQPKQTSSQRKDSWNRSRKSLKDNRPNVWHLYDSVLKNANSKEMLNRICAAYNGNKNVIDTLSAEEFKDFCINFGLPPPTPAPIATPEITYSLLDVQNTAITTVLATERRLYPTPPVITSVTASMPWSMDRLNINPALLSSSATSECDASEFSFPQQGTSLTRISSTVELQSMKNLHISSELQSQTRDSESTVQTIAYTGGVWQSRADDEGQVSDGTRRTMGYQHGLRGEKQLNEYKAMFIEASMDERSKYLERLGQFFKELSLIQAESAPGDTDDLMLAGCHHQENRDIMETFPPEHYPADNYHSKRQIILNTVPVIMSRYPVPEAADSVATIPQRQFTLSEHRYSTQDGGEMLERFVEELGQPGQAANRMASRGMLALGDEVEGNDEGGSGSRGDSGGAIDSFKAELTKTLDDLSGDPDVVLWFSQFQAWDDDVWMGGTVM
ncbi:Protein of unknown function [Pyronema omphalodes CBS 100304]|uniref:Uncharacterized protein n=1 Tax=Pyronema omphalodes (strain CBS 100304) TaxID=1076935 RepID=U4LC26_PYROM|nr:Protein of unknown function [Pyronema omphalodes CBS 100304]